MAWMSRTVPMILLLAGIGYPHDAQAQTRCAFTLPNTTCGLVVTPGGDGYNFIPPIVPGLSTVARAYVLNPVLSIYMDNRGLFRTQTLTVSGTDMTGYYVQGGVGGTANIFLENGAKADLIEAGAILLPATDVLIVVDNSVLNGAQPGRIYDRSGDKDYTLGSAIFIDPVDLGNHTINVVNGSQLNGSIVTGFGNGQTVSVDESTIDNGGIYVAGLGANTISVTNSTVDATNSLVAASLVELAQRIADSGNSSRCIQRRQPGHRPDRHAEQQADLGREHRYRRRGFTRSRSWHQRSSR